MKRIFLALALITLLALLSSCKGGKVSSERYTAYDNILDYAKPLAFGEDNDIYVFCGEQNWRSLEPVLRSSLERTVGLVYNEQYFRLIPVELDKLGEMLPYKNLVFAGDLKSSDEVSQHMRRSLTPAHLEQVQQTGGQLFVAKNHDSRDQVILYLLGTEPEQLFRVTNLQSSNIFRIMLERYSQRLAYQAFRGKVIGEDFWKNFPFSLKVPDTYRLYSNDAPARFLSLLYRSRMESREIPDKYISIYYEPMQTDSVDGQWLLNKRNEIWGKKFEGDIVPADKVRMERSSFAGFQGWKLIGPWENHTHLIGGAFQSMGFWDARTKRAYIVDNSVYFPAGDKLSILMELYMISSTFKLK